MNKYKIHVTGTHCASCKILIEDILGEQDFVKNAEVNLKEETVSLESDKGIDETIEILNEKIQNHKYIFSREKNITQPTDDIIWRALPLGLGVLALFFFLQKSGILNIGIGGGVTITTSFLIGLIASVSTCLAVVGGIVLSLSAKVSEDNVSDTKTFVLFHFGRLFSFAILGGILGLMGNAIGINFTFTSLLGILASLIMVLLGLNLVGALAKSKISLPAGIFNFFRKIEHKTLTPLIVGFATFFLPCGFTQSMQISALSSGSFFGGFGIMLAFALGTLPVLALLSFGSASFAQSKHAPLFFKTAGVVVIGLGIFALISGLAGLGIIKPVFNV